MLRSLAKTGHFHQFPMKPLISRLSMPETRQPIPVALPSSCTTLVLVGMLVLLGHAAARLPDLRAVGLCPDARRGQPSADVPAAAIDKRG